MPQSSKAPASSHAWRILAIGTGPKGALWHWEQRSQKDGTLLKRSTGFIRLNECLDDAMAHGYLAGAS